MSGAASGLAPASQLSAEPTHAPLAFILAIAKCAAAVRDAAFVLPEACAEAAAAAQLPKWSKVPEECGFKIVRTAVDGVQCYASKEQQTEQCEQYRVYTTWAWQCCSLSEGEFKDQLKAAQDVSIDNRCIEGLPGCLRHRPPSRAAIQFMLPRRVLISPLCDMNRLGCALSQEGKVLVEKREWTMARWLV